MCDSIHHRSLSLASRPVDPLTAHRLPPIATALATQAGMHLLGVNTDPARSVGALCGYALPAESAQHDAERLARSLAHGTYEVVQRPRLRAIIHNSLLPPCHALNEIFIGESDPARPIHFLLSVDDGAAHAASAMSPPSSPSMDRRLASGLLVSTKGERPLPLTIL